MSIPTNLDIAAVSYNGTSIPLATGDSVTKTTFTISAEDATTYATGLYTISDITCNYYIIVGQRTTGNGGYVWMYTPEARVFMYINSSSLAIFALNPTNIRTNNTYSRLVNNHPAIQSLNASYPLYADTYDIVYW